MNASTGHRRRLRRGPRHRLHRSPRLRATIGAAAVATSVLLTGCASNGEPDLRIDSARASQPVAGASQIVVDVVNEGDGADRLVDATTPAAAGTEIHHTTVEDGRATMEVLDEVEIPAGETVRFRPGGHHLMLTVPDESVVIGGTFELTLEFARSGEITVPVQVVEPHELLEPADSAPAEGASDTTAP